MKVLVLGGTRFAGLAVVRALVRAGAAVTVASRRAGSAPAGVEAVTGERIEALARLSGRQFDVVLDFIAYDGKAVGQLAAASVRTGLLILVSSAWISRRYPDTPVDGPVQGPATQPPTMMDLTCRYLDGKAQAEAATLAAGGVVVRLPVIWGARDHTGRLDFYRSRIRAGGGLLAVDGGDNPAQVVWSEDVAEALVRLLPKAASRPVWEGLPDGGAPVSRILQDIAQAEGRPVHLVPVARHRLEAVLPAYLEAEPLWRESALPLSAANIFDAVGHAPTPRLDWLARVTGDPCPPPDARMRAAELACIRELHHA